MDLDQRVEVDEDLVHDMQTCPLRMPKPETLFALLRGNFPDAVAISLIFSTIVVEFEEMDREVWAEMLETLPWAFKNISHTLTYSNGVLANAEFRRLKDPKPCKVNDAVVDDSDYVSAKGSFNPGAMLRSDQEDAITAGMLVRKDGQQTYCCLSLLGRRVQQCP